MLLIQFIFPSYDATNNGNQAVLSLDKYLGADVWLQIYKKIEPKLQAYHTTVELSKEEETINLSRAQLELNISWKPFRTYHKDVIRQDNGKSCDSPCAEKILNVKVRMCSALDKFKKKTEKKSTESTVDSESNASTSNAATENRTSNGSTSTPKSQNVEEYVPEPVTEIPSLDYTPSTLSLNSIENVVASPLSDDEHDVYTPSQRNGNNDSQIITYTPTKITHTSLKTTAKKTDLNWNDCTDKKNDKMKNLFGDSGDEIESRRLRSTAKPSQIEPEKPKLQGNLDEWVNKNRSKRPDTKKDCDRTDSKKKIRKIGTNEKSERDKKEMDECEKIRQLREQYEANEAMDDMVQCDVNIM